MNRRDWNEICAKCGEGCGSGHNTERGCLFAKGSGRKVNRPAMTIYCPPQFYRPTRLTGGQPSHNTITFVHGEDCEIIADAAESFKGIDRIRTNTNCGTCKEPFPYDPLPSNRPDGKTDCYRCKTMKGVFVS